MNKKTTADERVDKVMGERLSSARTAKSLTQKQMAECLGITAAAYQNYEYGREISSGRIVQICSILECSPNWLLGVKDTGESLSPDSPLLKELKDAFFRLSEPGQREAVKRVSELAKLPEYIVEVKKMEEVVPNSQGFVPAKRA